MSDTLWLYREPHGSLSGEFVLLVNSRGRSKCRRYDPITGIKIHEYRGGGQRYEQAFAEQISGARKLNGLVNAKVQEMTRGLPLEYLNELRVQVGLPPVPEGPVVKHVSSGGILNGVDGLIERTLGIEAGLRSKTVALALSKEPVALDGAALMERIYRQIEANWDGSACRSMELWRWKVNPHISAQNTSIEKNLEKRIVDAAPGWVNQIPAASGLLRTCQDGHVSVDLGTRLRPGEFELIELKAGPNADTPLRAAFEIIGYGLLYCFARLHLNDLGLPRVSELLTAKTVYLKVLGPQEIYLGYRLKWLADALDEGLLKFCRRKFANRLVMHFSFEAFPEEFAWTGCSEDELRLVLSKRQTHTF